MTAALSAAGIATSMAQVFSVNAVGYVNTVLKPGYNLISNPLVAADNSIKALLGNSLPNNSQVYTFDAANGFKPYQYLTAGGGRWIPDATAEVKPGTGFFVRNPGATDVTVTFVGEVEQGTLDNPIPAGLSIKSSRVPQEGTADVLQFPAANGDNVYIWDAAAQGYLAYNRAANRWFGGNAANPAPTLKVGQAMFVRKAAAANWTRTFTVN
jgi:hypothetical protein